MTRKTGRAGEKAGRASGLAGKDAPRDGTSCGLSSRQLRMPGIRAFRQARAAVFSDPLCRRCRKGQRLF